MFDIGTAILFLIPAAAIILLGPARLAHLGQLFRRIAHLLRRRTTHGLQQAQMRRGTRATTQKQ